MRMRKTILFVCFLPAVAFRCLAFFILFHFIAFFVKQTQNGTLLSNRLTP